MLKVEMLNILQVFYSYLVGGHHLGDGTTRKIFQRRPTIHKDTYDFVKTCDQCQRQRSIFGHLEIPMIIMLEVELFDL